MQAKPFSLRKTFDFAFKNMFTYFFSFIGISVVALFLFIGAIVPIVAVTLPYIYTTITSVVQGLMEGQLPDLPVTWLLFVALSFSAVLLGIVALWYSAALIKKACGIYDKKKTGVIASYAISFNVFWRYILGSFFIGLLFIASALLLWLPGSLLLSSGISFLQIHAPMTLKFFLGIGSLMLSALLFFAFFAAVLRLGVRMSIFCFIIIDKQMMSLRKALIHSSRLINGSLMHIVGSIIVLGVFNLIIGQIYKLAYLLPVTEYVTNVVAVSLGVFIYIISFSITMLFWAYIYKRLFAAKK